MSFTDKILKKGYKPLHFVRSKNLLGEDIYHFIFANDIELKKLKAENRDADSLNIADFGSVVAMGFGLIPNDEVLEKLSKEYNVNARALVPELKA
jgi:hypothetical protein